MADAAERPSEMAHLLQVFQPVERESGCGFRQHPRTGVKKKLVGEARRSHGRTEKTSFCIVDAQSVKNTDSAKNKGYDAGKKVSGIKRHIAVDTQGLPPRLKSG